jgi:hypothetical protein
MLTSISKVASETRDEIKKLTDDFLKKGGVIERIPYGMRSTESTTPFTLNRKKAETVEVAEVASEETDDEL